MGDEQEKGGGTGLKKEIYFAGGCFWGVEKYFSLIPGVLETEAGYANGTTKAPTYEAVCWENTGHAETVRVGYDSEQITLEDLLTRFYEIIDPTSLNRQGADRGPQYRTGIFYVEAEEKERILASLRKLQTEYEKPIVIEAVPLSNYYPAEEYHQHYLEKHPEGYCHIPRSAFLRAQIPSDEWRRSP